MSMPFDQPTYQWKNIVRLLALGFAWWIFLFVYGFLFAAAAYLLDGAIHIQKGAGVVNDLVGGAGVVAVLAVFTLATVSTFGINRLKISTLPLAVAKIKERILMKKRSLLYVALFVLLALLGYFVWPTPYIYFANPYPIRVHRITGKVEVWSSESWHTR